jgi:excisionase family DNA binding protein
MLTVRQVKERLNVALATVYSLLDSGELEGVRIGVGRGTWRVREESLQAYLERRTQKGKAASMPPVAPLRHIKLSE